MRSFFLHICGEQNKNLKYYQRVPMTRQTIISVGREVGADHVWRCSPRRCRVIAGNVDPTLIQKAKRRKCWLRPECVRQPNITRRIHPDARCEASAKRLQ